MTILTIVEWVLWVFILLIGVGKWACGSEDDGLRWMLRISGIFLMIGCLASLILPVSKFHLLWWLAVGHFSPILLFQFRMKRSARRISKGLADGVPLQELLARETKRAGVLDAPERTDDEPLEAGVSAPRIEDLLRDRDSLKSRLAKEEEIKALEAKSNSRGDPGKGIPGLDDFQRELDSMKFRLAKLQEIEALEAQSTLLGEILDLNELISSREQPTLEELRSQLADLEDYRNVNQRIRELRRQVGL